MIERRYLGHHGRTGAPQVMTPEGAERGARRLPEESRWSLKKWTDLQGFARDMVPKEGRRLEKGLGVREGC